MPELFGIRFLSKQFLGTFQDSEVSQSDLESVVGRGGQAWDWAVHSQANITVSQTEGSEQQEQAWYY